MFNQFIDHQEEGTVKIIGIETFKTGLFSPTTGPSLPDLNKETICNVSKFLGNLDIFNVVMVLNQVKIFASRGQHSCYQGEVQTI